MEARADPGDAHHEVGPADEEVEPVGEEDGHVDRDTAFAVATKLSQPAVMPTAAIPAPRTPTSPALSPVISAEHKREPGPAIRRTRPAPLAVPDRRRRAARSP